MAWLRGGTRVSMPGTGKAYQFANVYDAAPPMQMDTVKSIASTLQVNAEGPES